MTEQAAATGGVSKVSWITLVVISALLVAFGLFVLFSPVDPNDFEATTGLSWSAYSSANAEAAGYLEREARLLAVSFIGVGLFSLALAWYGVREGSDLAVKAMWILPVILVGSAVVFFLGEGTALGWYYAGIAVIAALAVARAASTAT